MTLSSTTKNLLDVIQRTQELGIEELVRNVVHQGGESKEHAEAVWEGCRLIFAAQPKADAQSQTTGGLFSHLSFITGAVDTIKAAASTKPNHELGTSIIMPDGTFLYNADGPQVKAFREGPWVERLTAYSKQLTEQRLQREREEEQKRLDEKRKPFQNIDF